MHVIVDTSTHIDVGAKKNSPLLLLYLLGLQRLPERRSWYSEHKVCVEYLRILCACLTTTVSHILWRDGRSLFLSWKMVMPCQAPNSQVSLRGVLFEPAWNTGNHCGHVLISWPSITPRYLHDSTCSITQFRMVTELWALTSFGSKMIFFWFLRCFEGGGGCHTRF